MAGTSTLRDNLRAWRERKKLSLERAAELIAIVAEFEGVSKGSKKVPRTHASLIRWEKGPVQLKEEGLEIIAKAYGIDVAQLRRPPPPEGQPPPRMVSVPADQADAVAAFIEGLNARKAG